MTRKTKKVAAETDAKRKAEQTNNFKPPKYSYGPSGADISCGNPDCCYQGDAGEFFTSRLGIELPHGDIQCPKCNWAVRRKWVNHEIKLTPIQPTL